MGLYSAFAPGSPRGSWTAASPRLPDFDGSIMVVLPTGTWKVESPSVVDSMVTPKTGFTSFGGSFGGSRLGGGVASGGGVTFTLGMILRSGSGGGGSGGVIFTSGG